jgi:divalent metal cation (Fe/Co/Zn/Cd) transporter
MSGSASKHDLDLIMDAILGCSEVEKLISLKTFAIDNDQFVVAVKIALPAEKTVRDVADVIAEIQGEIEKTVPAARAVYIQPDIYRPSLDPAPSTDVFVLKSED